MRKLPAALAALSILSLLAGCSSEKLNDYIQSKAADRSDIMNTDEYRTYEELRESGELDGEGRYIPPSGALSAPDGHAGQVNVTFASNGFIRVYYYKDPERTQPIDTDDCWLEPGERVYAPQIELSNPNSHYAFSHFRLVFDDGITEDVEPDSDGLILTVPEGREGGLISVMPMGDYLPRTVSLRDYYLTPDGRQVELSGKWTVNGQPVNSGSADVSPVQTCNVVYDYGDYAGDYYFVKGTPSATEAGTDVSFTDDGSDSFSVELRQYITVSVDNAGYSFFRRNIIKSVSVNGEIDPELNVKSARLTLSGLRCGDRIVILVDSGYAVTSPLLAVSGPASRDGGSVSEYRVTVPDTAETSLDLTVSKKSTARGLSSSASGTDAGAAGRQDLEKFARLKTVGT